MVIETERLILRYMTIDDFESLKEIISNPINMKFYEKPYDDNGVNRWINWNLDNYQTYGFGLFACILKETGKMIGDCGVTMQFINKKIRPEIGYHFRLDCHNKGYATEAAKAVKEYIFNNTTFKELYTYTTKENLPSRRVAEKNGMTLVEEYIDGNETLVVYKIIK
jgi:RimJ/RimL family protein N-acetyltransferase